MKHDWENKKLGEVCELRRGLTYSKGDEVAKSSKMVLRSNNIDLESMSLDLTEIKYLREDFVFPEEKMLQGGSVFLCMSNGSKNHVGKVAYIDKDINYAFGGFMGLIVPLEQLVPKFVYYVCRSSIWRGFMINIGKGIGITNLRFSELSTFPIPVPPIEEQKALCAELDALSLIIEKKKEQVKQLDDLAQSIFYDTFGDPITNEKGWDVRAIGNCFSYIKNGANIKQDKSQLGLPITRIETLSNGVFNRDRMGYAGITDPMKYQQYILNDKDLLMSHINSKAYIGRTVMYTKKGDETIVHGMNLLRLIPIEDLESVYFCFLAKTDFFKRKISSIRKDAVNQSSFAISDLKKITIPVPPLSLQQAFAEKVKAIERQKDLINQSIREVQTLFDSRMDYWFAE